ncbi:MAG: hypothetical protein ACI9LE_001252 [Paraglaciecola sp.]|jgi:hypothetical protein
MGNLTYEKPQIKRVNRLYGNVHLQHEIPPIYRQMCAAIVG